MVFGGTVGVNEGGYLSFQFQRNKKEREIICANFFCLIYRTLKDSLFSLSQTWGYCRSDPKLLHKRL